MPPHLKSEAIQHCFANVIKHLPSCIKDHQALMYDLCMQLSLMDVVPDELLIRKGQWADHLYLVTEGQCKVVSSEGETLKLLMQGAFFGVECIASLDHYRRTVMAVEPVCQVQIWKMNRYSAAEIFSKPQWSEARQELINFWLPTAPRTEWDTTPQVAAIKALTGLLRRPGAGTSTFSKASMEASATLAPDPGERRQSTTSSCKELRPSGPPGFEDIPMDVGMSPVRQHSSGFTGMEDDYCRAKEVVEGPQDVPTVRTGVGNTFVGCRAPEEVQKAIRLKAECIEQELKQSINEQLHALEARLAKRVMEGMDQLEEQVLRQVKKLQAGRPQPSGPGTSSGVG
uniref:Cyclic nucleotide-binding domain-containing protein n=1 Tax=Eutreptiella gymnastica TaxID=73025 RepID=A0A7S1IU69_9EUGL|mmetsp:Transcript_4290/g.7514  ORF Transcript_4290/g.7514 Transcript_4290/m.7514 type:complete len:342 (+) Transcript_4290:3-1028(+)